MEMRRIHFEADMFASDIDKGTAGAVGSKAGSVKQRESVEYSMFREYSAVSFDTNR